MSEQATHLMPPSLVLLSEREEQKNTFSNRMEHSLSAWPRRTLISFQVTNPTFIESVNRLELAQKNLTEAQLNESLQVVRLKLRRYGLKFDHIVESFAVIREKIYRSLGYHLHNGQLQGAYALLKGALAEMEGGEGKTLTAVLAATTAGLAGMPVHVITANDYLVRRDCSIGEAVFKSCGLNVSAVLHELSPELRKIAYTADIVYVSARELAYDYLRDRMQPGRRTHNISLKLTRLQNPQSECHQAMVRGLCFCIIDDADQVLLDEAQSPMVLSRQTDPLDERHRAEQVMSVVAGLDNERDYIVDHIKQKIKLTDDGRHQIEDRVDGWGGHWKSRLRSEESIRQGLVAQEMLISGEHYIVSEGKVHLLDRKSGEAMQGRIWGDGLHQLIEMKEGCEVSSRSLPVASITYPKLFRRYQHLAGLANTTCDVRGEFWRLYRLSTVRIQPDLPVQRNILPVQMFSTKEDKLAALIQRTRNVHATGQPVLIGVPASDDAKHIVQLLEQSGLLPVVIAVSSLEKEKAFALVASRGQVTVIINMPVLGEDISVTDEIAALGGLYVIHSASFDTQRMDRKLEMFTARRGAPGLTEKFLSHDDPLVNKRQCSILDKVGGYVPQLQRMLKVKLIRYAQWQQERLSANTRRDLVKRDHMLVGFLSYMSNKE